MGVEPFNAGQFEVQEGVRRPASRADLGSEKCRDARPLAADALLMPRGAPTFAVNVQINES